MADHEHRWRMIKSKDGSYHRVCMDCKRKQSAQVRRKPAAKRKSPVPVTATDFMRQGRTRIYRVQRGNKFVGEIELRPPGRYVAIDSSRHPIGEARSLEAAKDLFR